jgi:hypothetical protein
MIFGNLTFNDDPVTENGLVGLQVNSTSEPILLRTVSVGPYTLDPIVEVTSVISCDYYLNPKSSFDRGAEAYFYVVARNNDVISHTALITASIFEGANRPLPITSTYKIDNMIAGSYASARFGPVIIPLWATGGPSKVYANVFSDWPKNHGFPYSPEKSATFTIKELEYEGFTHPPSSGTWGIMGTNSYNLTLRLSPETSPGLYRVHASASLGLWNDYSTCTFTVPSGPYPPKASYDYIPRPEAWIGVNMTFDGSESVAVGYGDTIKQYKWNFGDGTPIQVKTTPKIYKIYAVPNTYTVTLNVTDNEGKWNTTSKQIPVLAEKKDIAVTMLDGLTEIYSDWIVNVTITVKNLGGPNPATFNLRLLYNDTLIGTRNVVNLQPWPYGIVTHVFTWNTSGLATYVSYIQKAEVDILVGETNTTNNVRTLIISKVKKMGDVTGDKKVNIFDVVSVTSAYGSRPGQPNWNVQADLVRDNVINIYDVVAVTSRYGQSYGS